MKRRYIFLCMMIVCSVYSTMQAELLVVQKEEDGRFITPSAKDAEDVWGPIKNYQWPQCIISTSTMSDQEKTDLLSPGKPYATKLPDHCPAKPAPP